MTEAIGYKECDSRTKKQKEGRKEMYVLWCTQHILFMVIWHQIDGKGPHRQQERETCCHNYMGYYFQLAARYILYAPSHRYG